MNLTLVEVFLRILPEQFLFIFGTYMLVGKKINIKRMLLSSTILAVVIFPTRLLPTQYGIHTILSLAILVFINIKINKLKVIKSIQTSVFLVILLILAEMVNIILITYVLKVDVKSIFNNPTLKAVYGLPSLAIFGALSFVLGKKLNKAKKHSISA